MQTDKEAKSAVIFTGIPASGKTTFYEENFAFTHVHISLDALRTRSREKLLLENCIADGASFAVDNTNPMASDRAKYILPAKEAGYRIIGYYFKSSVAECVARNELRTGKAKVPAVAIGAISGRLEIPKLSEGFDELYEVFIENGKFTVNRLEDIL